MSPDWFDAMARALARARSRRGALALVLATAIGAVVSGEDAVNARKRLKRKPSAKSGKKHSGKKRKNRKGKKGKKGKRSASGSSCAVHHSEQQILDFIGEAARKYGQPENAMVRVARCESNLNPCAVNRSGPYYGLFQYLKGTWKSTPYGDRDIFDPEAQALATGWMWKEGRRNEWACQ